MQNDFNNYGTSTSKPNVEPSNSGASSDDLFADYPSHSEIQKEKSVNSDTNPQLEEPEYKIRGNVSADAFIEGTSEFEKSIQELNQLIGLYRVKEEIQRLIQYVRIQEIRRARGIAKSPLTLHAVFYGNPGTGKTTIARLYGKMLKALGILSQGHLVETDRAGLVANYIGQTATKTDSRVKEALGGILFIDEAYSLSKGDNAQWDYGNEALEILIKRMEDFRENLVVIAAGYPEPMERFIKSNEGLRSRFSTYINFDDYTPSEMLQIFQLFCQRENYDINDQALELVLAAIEYEYNLRDNTFGNARFVRNFFEIVIRNHASRIGITMQNPTLTDLRLILPEDVPLITKTGI